MGVLFLAKRDFSVFALKIPDALPDQMQDLSVSGTPFILGDVVELIMQLRIYLDAQVFVVLVSHKSPQNILI